MNDWDRQLQVVTREALEASISKWEQKLKSAKAGALWDIELGPQSCPLCTLFYGKGCMGCPISERTGTHLCSASPYEDVVIAFEEADELYSNDYWDTDEDFKKAQKELVDRIVDEVNFLKSLRKKKK